MLLQLEPIIGSFNFILTINGWILFYMKFFVLSHPFLLNVNVKKNLNPISLLFATCTYTIQSAGITRTWTPEMEMQRSQQAVHATMKLQQLGSHWKI
jgi:hypothetical protein